MQGDVLFLLRCVVVPDLYQNLIIRPQSLLSGVGPPPLRQAASILFPREARPGYTEPIVFVVSYCTVRTASLLGSYISSTTTLLHT
jgi:hypothetical protein